MEEAQTREWVVPQAFNAREILFTVTDEVTVDDYHTLMAHIRDRDEGVGPVWLREGWMGLMVTRAEDIEECYKNWQVFSPEVSHGMLTEPFMGPSMVGMEGKRHIDFRKLVMNPFRKENLDKTIRPQLRQVADNIINEFAGNGEAELMAQFCKKYPMAVIGTILGIPTDNWDQLSSWARDIFLGTSHEQRIASSEAFARYVDDIIAERQANPQDDLITELCSAEIDGDRLTNDDIRQFMMLLFPAGVDTTWLSIGSMMVGILSTEGVRERLLAEPALRENAVQEALRWEGPIGFLPRITREDTTLGGYHVPAGSAVCMVHSAANRDPKLYPNPDEFIIDREAGKIMSFSFGPHQCLGQHLARMEMRVALDALLEGLPSLALKDNNIPYWGTSVRGPSAVKVSFTAR